MTRWLVVLLLASTACGGGASQQSAGGDRGADVYAATCAACHGPAGAGTDVGPPLLDQTYEPGHHGDDAFRRAIARGVAPHHWNFGPMPPQAQLADADVDAVIAHVRRLQREAGID